MSFVCPHCGQEFKGDLPNARHLAKCAPHLSPKVDPCLCGHESTSLTQMKRHRRTCATWKGRDKKAVLQARQQATLMARYGEGVLNARHAPGAEEKRSATNLERYGAENPFAREASTFGKVQASLEGKRPVFHGQDNRFSHPETQVLIRRRMKEKHEAFGDFWHSKMFTGKAPFEHESELVAAYAEVGLECLVIWESEVKTDPESVKTRLAEFLV